MDLIIFCLLSIIALIVLYVVYGVNMKKLKSFEKNEKLDNITNALPNNVEVCKKYLKKLKNENVNIKEDKEKGKQASLYIVATNTIFIADIKDSYSRIQTIAHECIHSVQSKKMLMFNFIFSNIFILYWLIVTILGITGILENTMLQVGILLLMSFMFYAVRVSLETDAMLKARYLSKEYMEETKILTEENINEIVQEYDKINDLGIKMVQYSLFMNCIVKVLIFSIACQIGQFF